MNADMASWLPADQFHAPRHALQDLQGALGVPTITGMAEIRVRHAERNVQLARRLLDFGQV